MKTCVIGDIHGCAASLIKLLNKVTDMAETIVFLGDYVDRGPDSRQVIDTLLHLRKTHPRPIFLKGNHELMFYDYLIGADMTSFLRVGGRQTLVSYDISTEIKKNIPDLLPPGHASFIENLPMLYEDQHAIYVHAGLQPGRHLSQQTSQWCLWARDEFINSSWDFGKPVIFGHTPFDEPLIQANKTGIDTGAVYGGTLTALILPDMEFIQVEGEKEHPFLR